MPTPKPNPYVDRARAYAEKYGIDPNIFLRLIQAESNWNPRARNASSGAMGLGQLIPGTAAMMAKRLGIEHFDPFNPDHNLEASAAYLRYIKDSFDARAKRNPAFALRYTPETADQFVVAGYNAGPASVQKYKGIPPFPETENYVSKIFGQPIKSRFPVDPVVQNKRALDSTFDTIGRAYPEVAQQLKGLFTEETFRNPEAFKQAVAAGTPLLQNLKPIQAEDVTTARAQGKALPGEITTRDVVKGPELNPFTGKPAGPAGTETFFSKDDPLTQVLKGSNWLANLPFSATPSTGSRPRTPAEAQLGGLEENLKAAVGSIFEPFQNDVLETHGAGRQRYLAEAEQNLALRVRFSADPAKRKKEEQEYATLRKAVEALVETPPGAADHPYRGYYPHAGQPLKHISAPKELEKRLTVQSFEAAYPEMAKALTPFQRKALLPALRSVRYEAANVAEIQRAIAVELGGDSISGLFGEGFKLAAPVVRKLLGGVAANTANPAVRRAFEASVRKHAGSTAGIVLRATGDDIANVLGKKAEIVAKEMLPYLGRRERLNAAEGGIVTSLGKAGAANVALGAFIQGELPTPLEAREQFIQGVGLGAIGAGTHFVYGPKDSLAAKRVAAAAVRQIQTVAKQVPDVDHPQAVDIVAGNVLRAVGDAPAAYFTELDTELDAVKKRLSPKKATKAIGLVDAVKTRIADIRSAATTSTPTNPAAAAPAVPSTTPNTAGSPAATPVVQPQDQLQAPVVTPPVPATTPATAAPVADPQPPAAVDPAQDVASGPQQAMRIPRQYSGKNAKATNARNGTPRLDKWQEFLWKLVDYGERGEPVTENKLRKLRDEDESFKVGNDVIRDWVAFAKDSNLLDADNIPLITQADMEVAFPSEVAGAVPVATGNADPTRDGVESAATLLGELDPYKLHTADELLQAIRDEDGVVDPQGAKDLYLLAASGYIQDSENGDGTYQVLYPSQQELQIEPEVLPAVGGALDKLVSTFFDDSRVIGTAELDSSAAEYDVAYFVAQELNDISRTRTPTALDLGLAIQHAYEDDELTAEREFDPYAEEQVVPDETAGAVDSASDAASSANTSKDAAVVSAESASEVVGQRLQGGDLQDLQAHINTMLPSKEDYYIDRGGNASVYALPGTDYVVRIPHAAHYVTWVDGLLTVVPDPFEGRNFGQAVAVDSKTGISVLLRQSGKPAGLAIPIKAKEGVRTEAEAQQMNDTAYASAVRSAAALPQKAYDSLAASLEYVHKRGYAFDPSKSNNILIDQDASAFNIVDLHEGAYRADAGDIIVPLMGNTYAWRYKGPTLQREYAAIINKSMLAAERANLPAPKDTSSLAYSFELAGMNPVSATDTSTAVADLSSVTISDVSDADKDLLEQILTTPRSYGLSVGKVSEIRKKMGAYAHDLFTSLGLLEEFTAVARDKQTYTSQRFVPGAADIYSALMYDTEPVAGFTLKGFQVLLRANAADTERGVSNPVKHYGEAGLEFLTEYKFGRMGSGPRKKLWLTPRGTAKLFSLEWKLALRAELRKRGVWVLPDGTVDAATEASEPSSTEGLGDPPPSNDEQSATDIETPPPGDSDVPSASSTDIEAQSNSENTQRSNTVAGYKGASTLAAQGRQLGETLDYGAGFGLGADELRKQTPTVDTYEPNPQKWQSVVPVTFTKSNEITKQYDTIVALNVLNVLEPALRTQVLQHIGALLKPNGVAIIGTRAWKGDVATTKSMTPATEEHAVWVKNAGKDVYQRGFDGDELYTYVQATLPGFTVEKIRGSSAGATSVRVTRLAEEATDSASATEDQNTNDVSVAAEDVQPTAVPEVVQQSPVTQDDTALSPLVPAAYVPGSVFDSLRDKEQGDVEANLRSVISEIRLAAEAEEAFVSTHILEPLLAANTLRPGAEDGGFLHLIMQESGVTKENVRYEAQAAGLAHGLLIRQQRLKLPYGKHSPIYALLMAAYEHWTGQRVASLVRDDWDGTDDLAEHVVHYYTSGLLTALDSKRRVNPKADETAPSLIELYNYAKSAAVDGREQRTASPETIAQMEGTAPSKPVPPVRPAAKPEQPAPAGHSYTPERQTGLRAFVAGLYTPAVRKQYAERLSSWETAISGIDPEKQFDIGSYFDRAADVIGELAYAKHDDGVVLTKIRQLMLPTEYTMLGDFAKSFNRTSDEKLIRIADLIGTDVDRLRAAFTQIEAQATQLTRVSPAAWKATVTATVPERANSKRSGQLIFHRLLTHVNKADQQAAARFISAIAQLRTSAAKVANTDEAPAAEVARRTAVLRDTFALMRAAKHLFNGAESGLDKYRETVTTVLKDFQRVAGTNNAVKDAFAAASNFESFDGTMAEPLIQATAPVVRFAEFIGTHLESTPIGQFLKKQTKETKSDNVAGLATLTQAQQYVNDVIAFIAERVPTDERDSEGRLPLLRFMDTHMSQQQTRLADVYKQDLRTLVAKSLLDIAGRTAEDPELYLQYGLPLQESLAPLFAGGTDVSNLHPIEGDATTGVKGDPPLLMKMKQKAVDVVARVRAVKKVVPTFYNDLLMRFVKKEELPPVEISEKLAVSLPDEVSKPLWLSGAGRVQQVLLTLQELKIEISGDLSGLLQDAYVINAYADRLIAALAGIKFKDPASAQSAYTFVRAIATGASSLLNEIEKQTKQMMFDRAARDDADKHPTMDVYVSKLSHWLPSTGHTLATAVPFNKSGAKTAAYAQAMSALDDLVKHIERVSLGGKELHGLVRDALLQQLGRTDQLKSLIRAVIAAPGGEHAYIEVQYPVDVLHTADTKLTTAPSVPLAVVFKIAAPHSVTVAHRTLIAIPNEQGVYELYPFNKKHPLFHAMGGGRVLQQGTLVEEALNWTANVSTIARVAQLQGLFGHDPENANRTVGLKDVKVPDASAAGRVTLAGRHSSVDLQLALLSLPPDVGYIYNEWYPTDTSGHLAQLIVGDDVYAFSLSPSLHQQPADIPMPDIDPTFSVKREAKAVAKQQRLNLREQVIPTNEGSAAQQPDTAPREQLIPGVYGLSDADIAANAARKVQQPPPPGASREERRAWRKQRADAYNESVASGQEALRSKMQKTVKDLSVAIGDRFSEDLTLLMDVSAGAVTDETIQWLADEIELEAASFNERFSSRLLAEVDAWVAQRNEEGNPPDANAITDFTTVRAAQLKRQMEKEAARNIMRAALQKKYQYKAPLSQGYTWAILPSLGSEELHGERRLKIQETTTDGAIPSSPQVYRKIRDMFNVPVYEGQTDQSHPGAASITGAIYLRVFEGTTIGEELVHALDFLLSGPNTQPALRGFLASFLAEHSQGKRTGMDAQVAEWFLKIREEVRAIYGDIGDDALLDETVAKPIAAWLMNPTWMESDPVRKAAIDWLFRAMDQYYPLRAAHFKIRGTAFRPVIGPNLSGIRSSFVELGHMFRLAALNRVQSGTEIPTTPTPSEQLRRTYNKWIGGDLGINLNLAGALTFLAEVWLSDRHARIIRPWKEMVNSAISRTGLGPKSTHEVEPELNLPMLRDLMNNSTTIVESVLIHKDVDEFHPPISPSGRVVTGWTKAPLIALIEALVSDIAPNGMADIKDWTKEKREAVYTLLEHRLQLAGSKMFGERALHYYKKERAKLAKEHHDALMKEVNSYFESYAQQAYEQRLSKLAAEQARLDGELKAADAELARATLDLAQAKLNRPNANYRRIADNVRRKKEALEWARAETQLLMNEQENAKHAVASGIEASFSVTSSVMLEFLTRWRNNSELTWATQPAGTLPLDDPTETAKNIAKPARTAVFETMSRTYSNLTTAQKNALLDSVAQTFFGVEKASAAMRTQLALIMEESDPAKMREAIDRALRAAHDKTVNVAEGRLTDAERKMDELVQKSTEVLDIARDTLGERITRIAERIYPVSLYDEIEIETAIRGTDITAKEYIEKTAPDRVVMYDKIRSRIFDAMQKFWDADTELVKSLGITAEDRIIGLENYLQEFEVSTNLADSRANADTNHFLHGALGERFGLDPKGSSAPMIDAFSTLYRKYARDFFLQPLIDSQIFTEEEVDDMTDADPYYYPGQAATGSTQRPELMVFSPTGVRKPDLHASIQAFEAAARTTSNPVKAMIEQLRRIVGIVQHQRFLNSAVAQYREVQTTGAGPRNPSVLERVAVEVNHDAAVAVAKSGFTQGAGASFILPVQEERAYRVLDATPDLETGRIPIVRPGTRPVHVVAVRPDNRVGEDVYRIGYIKPQDWDKYEDSATSDGDKRALIHWVSPSMLYVPKALDFEFMQIVAELDPRNWRVLDSDIPFYFANAVKHVKPQFLTPITGTSIVTNAIVSRTEQRYEVWAGAPDYIQQLIGAAPTGDLPAILKFGSTMKKIGLVSSMSWLLSNFKMDWVDARSSVVYTSPNSRLDMRKAARAEMTATLDMAYKVYQEVMGDQAIGVTREQFEKEQAAWLTHYFRHSGGSQAMGMFTDTQEMNEQIEGFLSDLLGVAHPQDKGQLGKAAVRWFNRTAREKAQWLEEYSRSRAHDSVMLRAYNDFISQYREDLLYRKANKEVDYERLHKNAVIYATHTALSLYNHQKAGSLTLLAHAVAWPKVPGIQAITRLIDNVAKIAWLATLYARVPVKKGSPAMRRRMARVAGARASGKYDPNFPGMVNGMDPALFGYDYDLNYRKVIRSTVALILTNHRLFTMVAGAIAAEEFFHWWLGEMFGGRDAAQRHSNFTVPTGLALQKMFPQIPAKYLPENFFTTRLGLQATLVKAAVQGAIEMAKRQQGWSVDEYSNYMTGAVFESIFRPVVGLGDIVAGTDTFKIIRNVHPETLAPIVPPNEQHLPVSRREQALVARPISRAFAASINRIFPGAQVDPRQLQLILQRYMAPEVRAIDQAFSAYEDTKDLPAAALRGTYHVIPGMEDLRPWTIPAVQRITRQMAEQGLLTSSYGEEFKTRMTAVAHETASEPMTPANYNHLVTIAKRIRPFLDLPVYSHMYTPDDSPMFKGWDRGYEINNVVSVNGLYVKLDKKNFEAYKELVDANMKALAPSYRAVYDGVFSGTGSRSLARTKVDGILQVLDGQLKTRFIGEQMAKGLYVLPTDYRGFSFDAAFSKDHR